MKKITEPIVYPEVTEHPSLVKWEECAIESLQSLERYTILKAIDEGKRLIKRVMEIASKDTDVVGKYQIQNAISIVLEEFESKRKPSSI